MKEPNFSYLLLALLILLLGIPLANDLSLTRAPIARAIVFSALLVIGVWSLRGAGRFYSAGMAFVILGVLLNILAFSLSSPYWLYSSYCALLGFVVTAVSYTLKMVVVGTEINANRLVGAICVYLLLGVMWSFLYTLVDLLDPGSFNNVSATESLRWDSDWLYFSFVTMTTLGYGDISPISATAKFLAYLQAVFGQFYIAILVAGLVSAHIANRSSGSHD